MGLEDGAERAEDPEIATAGKVDGSTKPREG